MRKELDTVSLRDIFKLCVSVEGKDNKQVKDTIFKDIDGVDIRGYRIVLGVLDAETNEFIPNCPPEQTEAIMLMKV